MNVQLSAQLEGLSTAGQSVRLVARYTLGATNLPSYYEARLTRNSDGSVLAGIYQVSNGAAAVALRTARWQGVPSAGEMRFEVSGSRLVLRIAGLELAVVNTALNGPGLMGLAVTSGVDLVAVQVHVG